jgi:hypothetical protein
MSLLIKNINHMKTKIMILGMLMTTSLMYLQAQNEKNGNIKYANITEWGFLGSPNERYFSFEGTTVNGFSINGNVIGIGFGLGLGADKHIFGIYCPMFLNYRHYFNYENKFSPHINLALGGVSRVEGLGIYSALTTGFRSHKFSFSSGIFFQAYEAEVIQYEYDKSGNLAVETSVKEIYFPWGILLKIGFSF